MGNFEVSDRKINQVGHLAPLHAEESEAFELNY